MLKKIGVLAALTLSGAALFVPDATFARGSMGGGFGGFRGGGFRAPAVIHRAPFMTRTGPAALGRNGRAFRPLSSTLPPPVAKPLPVATHVGKPFAHFARRDHGRNRRSVDGFIYPYTTWDDGYSSGSYVGIPYDPGASIPVYAPAPMIAPVTDPLPPLAPRLSGVRYDNQEACRAERVTVPGSSGGDREITVVRC
jgi:hypothetical protein